MKDFEELNIEEPLLKTIKQAGFQKPTLIQEKTIPLVLEGKDVIAGSATGSGKTLVFGTGIIQNCEKGKGLQALVITPTRELAEQVGKELKKFSHHKALKIVMVYGGVGIEPQIEKLRKADVVVGTPGRLLDHLQRGTINFRQIKTLILDEADRMLDMGFIDDIRKIISQCNRHRQTMLFSATIMPEIQKLASNYMKNPVRVSAENQVDPKKLTQVYYDVSDKMKLSLLVHLLREEKSKLVMVFSNSRRSADFIAQNLEANGVNARAIHAGLSQNMRDKIMEMFHSGKINVLVCTDVAARGIDIKGVSHVYNYDIPKESKQYIHRIGRTARAGKGGKAINLVSQNDFENFDRVLRDNDVEVKKVKTPYLQSIRVVRQNTFKSGNKPQDRRYKNEGKRVKRQKSYR